MSDAQQPQISFPGCVRAYLGEDGTTPCLHKANIPTNNNIVNRHHFDVLCLQQFAREPGAFDGYDVQDDDDDDDEEEGEEEEEGEGDRADSVE